MHGLSLEAISEFLAEFAALIEPVEVHFQWRPQTPDPNDETVLETAIDGRANAVVTYNVADFAAAAKRFNVSLLRLSWSFVRRQDGFESSLNLVLSKTKNDVSCGRIRRSNVFSAR